MGTFGSVRAHAKGACKETRGEGLIDGFLRRVRDTCVQLLSDTVSFSRLVRPRLLLK